MPDEKVRIKLRLGAAEVEIEATKGDLKEMIELVPELADKLSPGSQTPAPVATVPAPQDLPEVKFGKGESLPAIVLKLFNNSWGRQPKKLQEVKETLETYGLVYPKQSVAVALLRLAKDGKLRRFKQPDGEFVYTASTTLLSPEFRAPVPETPPGGMN